MLIPLVLAWSHTYSVDFKNIITVPLIKIKNSVPLDVRNQKKSGIRLMMHISYVVSSSLDTCNESEYNSDDRSFRVPGNPYLKKVRIPCTRKSVPPQVRTSESPYSRKSVLQEIRTSGNMYLWKPIQPETRTSGNPYIRKSVHHRNSGVGSRGWDSICRPNVFCVGSTCLEIDCSREGVVFLSIRSSVCNNEHM